MNRREINLHGMLLTVEEFLIDNQSSFANKPAILSCMATLKEKNAGIESLSQAQAISTKADFLIKGDDKKSLIDTAIKISDGMKGHAAATQDTRLKVEAEISRWDMNRMRENDLVIRLKRLHEVALPLATYLLESGISQAEIDSLDTNSDKLMKTNPAIQNVKAKTTQATAEMGQTVVDTNNMLRDTLDPLMLQFKTLNATLYGEYQNARKIIDRPAGYSKKEVEVQTK